MQMADTELWEYIREDLPYFDLTTHLLDLPSQKMNLSIITRDDIIVACTEESARIAELLGCSVLRFVPSRTPLKKQGVLLELQGSHEVLHRAWRLCQILLEYACGMATQANTMLQSVRAVNPHCEILTTRKSYPFAKRFAIRALLCGGVLPHRLGLSETVLIFAQHRALYPNNSAFQEAMKELKSRCVEKKLVIESETFEDAKAMLSLGADVIQMDKCTLQTLHSLVEYKNNYFPQAAILIAGGVNHTNIVQFAQTGVDGVVTSSPYQAKMADLTSQMRNV